MRNYHPTKLVTSMVKFMKVKKINFYKRFELDNNLIIQKLLGELATEPYIEVIVREVEVKAFEFASAGPSSFLKETQNI